MSAPVSVQAPAEAPHRCPTCLLIGTLRRTGALWLVRSVALGTLRPGGKPARRGGPRTGLRSALARTVYSLLKPCDRHRGLGNALVPALGIPEFGTLLDRPSAAEPPPTTGINLVGYLRADSGLGEAARLMASAVRAAQVPHVLIDYHDGAPHPRSDTSLGGFARRNPHTHNLVHVNGDQVPIFARAAGRAFFEGRRSVGYWHWEQLGVPVEWAEAFSYFDEIWTPTRFTVDAIARTSPVPVRRVPLPVVPWGGPRLGRRRFELPDGRFVFLFLFNYHSVFERKNPLAVVEAFRRAFGGSERALLVIKCSHPEVDPANAARLARAAQHPSVRLIDGSFTRTEIASLIAASDAFVSLHRSEGFGLGLAEAMLAGKPVIATDWSGNTDFMTAQNSYPVRCALTTLERDVGPYRAGNQWAEPDVEHAAHWMRHVVEQPQDVALRVAQAQADLAAGFSPAAVAVQLRAILSEPARDTAR